ncbi:uncharacterized protein YjiK [Lewinella marina]|uniref:SMP-30/Gluconolactonase/LRE-like region domain-containing protein n=1 Tax=Neolewinella marina TaxID=438751 RepID=A0A2G0CF16_9BACT|nr:SdiA-regulated domain-containing protein [Neolewinella marina]NJB85755.1 uncharacterized protein YjiK [Neolewinella marina]PHK98571.1 hypothetical protein CGL56_08845 [Neolewinella marina]
MNKLWEKPNLISVVILLIVLGIGITYVMITVNQRPETESFTVDDDYFFPYNFDRLDRVVKLPSELNEISGLCAGFNPNELFAIQDEEGELFLVNSVSGKTINRVRFDKNRDYEGITRRDREIYVLETDGDIHQFTYQDSLSDIPATKLETDFSYRNDTEGICYDPVTNSLLIVPKEQELNPAADNESRRGIYTFDLATKRLNPQPTYYIDQLQVGQIVFGSNREYIIKPSGIAVDPFTNDIFVISSVGNILVVIDRDSQIKHVELLEKATFTQPEGITFSETGELYISSEGRGGRGIVATLTRMQPPTNEQ